MNYNKQILKWTHSVYASIQSLHMMRSLKLGNLKYLEKNIEDSINWIQSDIGFISNVPSKPIRKGSIKLYGGDEDNILQNLTQNLCELLLSELLAISDEILNEILLEKGLNPGTYLSQKLDQFTLNPKYQWAKYGIKEAITIRNCFIHSNSKWSQRAINDLSTFIAIPPTLNRTITIGFDDLFRYKRAVRTFLNEANK